MRFLRTTTALGLFVLLAEPGLAQQGSLATLTGTVMTEGAELPGVKISVTSPALQGTRSTVSSANGSYILPLLRAGDYTVTFELSGFQTHKQVMKLNSAQTNRLDAKLSLSSVAAEATVTASQETISQTQKVSTTFTAETLSKLPIARTFQAAVLLAPGTNGNGPGSTGTAAVITISGAQSYESLFLVNGVVVNENLRGQALNLYIEDAVQETTTSTSAISAEYGRFSGGVVNVITKSGGNVFSGSFRTSFANDAWTAVSPAKETRVQTVIPTYEATLGGPFVKDHLWFFGGFRSNDRSDQGGNQTTITKIPYVGGPIEKRYEGKLTFSITPQHTLTGAYQKIDQTNINGSQFSIMDLASLYNSTQPQQLYSGNYSGTLTPNFFLEGQYSRRDFTFHGTGSPYTDIIRGTLLQDVQNGTRYHTSTFCGVCQDELRNNENYLAKASTFYSSKELGSHNIVAGYDHYNDIRNANNHQSGSDYRVQGTTTYIRDNVIYPVWSNNGSSTVFQYNPIALLAQDTAFVTYGVFLNDSWQVTSRLSANLGLRYDKNNGKNSAGVTTANDSAWSPRLGLVYDVTGKGELRVNFYYGKYVQAIANNIADGTSAAGQPQTYRYSYNGPAINVGVTDATPLSQLITQDAAIQSIFDWYRANLAANKLIFASAPSIPGLTAGINGTLISPSSEEFTTGVNGSIGKRGVFRVDAVYRKYSNFYSSRTDPTTGTVSDPFGRQFDFALTENTNDVSRKYLGLHTQASYRALDRLVLGGNWTWSHSYGNFDGETSSNGPISTGIHSYPEYFDPKWNLPNGDLSIDQRHKVRLYGSYDIPVPSRFGSMSVSFLHSLDTGTPYGAVGTVATAAYVPNAAALPYKSAPTLENYYFTSRDAFRTPTINHTDLALNFGFKFHAYTDFEIFVSPQITNLFNNQGVRVVNTAVLANSNSAANFAKFNPFTTQPVKRTDTTDKTANWDFGPLFGTATSVTSYQNPRTFQVSAGLRF
jgi:Carboxypeptidase regulatory-like domain/TonB dependent receptor/TonB-dependent Receptor Plug Domain